MQLKESGDYDGYFSTKRPFYAPCDLTSVRLAEAPSTVWDRNISCQPLFALCQKRWYASTGRCMVLQTSKRSQRPTMKWKRQRDIARNNVYNYDGFPDWSILYHSRQCIALIGRMSIRMYVPCTYRFVSSWLGSIYVYMHRQRRILMNFG
jgi:hypothetical protein